MRPLAGWRALERKAARAVERTANRRALFAADGLAAAKRLAAADTQFCRRLEAAAERAMADRVEVFGACIPPGRPWPWTQDWRFGEHWPNRYFLRYSFYGPRERPYDVKFPWELSRLGAVVSLLQASCLFADPKHAAKALGLVQEWRQCNPLAYSVNWVPMEASLRTVNLALALELAGTVPDAAGTLRRDLTAELTLLLLCHGEFVFRVREYTDTRGNHYTANLVALLLAGFLFQDVYAPAKAWYRLADAELRREIGRQFSPDGVNFEKSVGYHRLVTELFLLAAAVLEKAERPFSAAAKTILGNACRYALACRRPDGLSVNAGDSDDACGIGLDEPRRRDHAAAIGFGAALLKDGELAGAVPRSIATAWLLGEVAGAPAKPADGVEWFADGGVLVVRNGLDHVWIDVGEVGQNGIGGHGHNDLLSFELSLDGQALIVDAGTYLYTGDLAARTWFRGTAAHNGLEIDGQEIAPLQGPWRIAGVAQPYDVQCMPAGASASLAASHRGYERLADPVRHTRRFDVFGKDCALRIVDRLACAGTHQAVRRLHFVPGARIELGPDRAIVECMGRHYLTTWNAFSTAAVEDGWISDHFGQRAKGPVLVLRDKITAGGELALAISRSEGRQ